MFMHTVAKMSNTEICLCFNHFLVTWWPTATTTMATTKNRQQSIKFISILLFQESGSTLDTENQRFQNRNKRVNILILFHWSMTGEWSEMFAIWATVCLKNLTWSVIRSRYKYIFNESTWKCIKAGEIKRSNPCTIYVIFPRFDLSK